MDVTIPQSMVAGGLRRLMEELTSLWVTGRMSQGARPLSLPVPRCCCCRLGHKFSESERCDHMVTCSGGGMGGEITASHLTDTEEVKEQPLKKLPRSQFHHDYSGRSLTDRIGFIRPLHLFKCLRGKRVNPSTRRLPVNKEPSHGAPEFPQKSVSLFILL